MHFPRLKGLQIEWQIQVKGRPELLRELVALGAGVSIVSALSVADDVQAGKLLTFDLEETPVFRHIYMVYRKKGTLSELERAFLQQIRRTV